MTTYQVHGLNIATAVHLTGCFEAGAMAPDVHVADFVVPKVDKDEPAGTIILRGQWSDGSPSYYGAARDDGTFHLRLPGALDVDISADGTTVLCEISSLMPNGLLEVLIPGIVTSFLLRTRGELVLHASCVGINGVAYAFTGNSGMGKTTVAALLCDHGASLVTDDILHVRVGPEPVVCRGTGHLRLRRTTKELGLHMAMLDVTPDGRHTVRPTPAEAETPLRSIVIPIPDRKNAKPVVEQIASRDAVALLRHFDHLEGWEDPGIAAQQFLDLAELVARVPVFKASVPWGLPFPKGAAEELLEVLGQASV